MISDAALGERIRLIRNEKGIKLEQLAEMVGISGGYMSMVENGNRRPSRKVLNDICDHLNTSAPLIQDPALDIQKLTKLSDLLEALSRLDNDNLDLVYEMAKRLAP